MLHPLILAADADPAFTGNTLLSLGLILSVALNALALLKNFSGKGQERQVEPTQLAAISEAIADQSDTLSYMNRELGQLTVSFTSITENLVKMERNQREDIMRTHVRIDKISEGVSELTARVDGLERLCPAAKGKGGC